MFILNKDKNAIINVRNIDYIELADSQIWVSTSNDCFEVGEYKTKEEAMTKFKKIISNLGTFDNQIFIEM